MMLTRQPCTTGRLSSQRRRCLHGSRNLQAHDPRKLWLHRGAQSRSASSYKGFVHQAAASDTIVTERPDAVRESTNLPFSWTSRWWPVLPVESLDTKIPQHVDLLGLSLVLWADSKGTWHCLEDRCPHRLAPLSEGRVEGDTLMCSYHGWTFSSAGACTRIPQLDHDPKAQASACSSKRSCAKAYPVRFASGLVWVWPEAGPGVAGAAAAQAPQELPEGLMSWYMRDMPIRYDTVAENLLDVSHVPFAHHSSKGGPINRNRAAVFNDLSTGPVTEHGFTGTVRTPRGETVIDFKPPFLVTYRGMAGLELIIIPTKPGWSRLFTTVSKTVPKVFPFPIRQLLELQRNHPALYHIMDRNGFLDGDAYLLHMAERLLPIEQGLGATQLARSCYMPAPTDLMVTSYRTWLERFGGNVPTCSLSDVAAIPPVLPKEQALDRWTQHTQHCPNCKAFLASVERFQLAAKVLGSLAAATCVAVTVAGAQAAAAGAATAAAAATGPAAAAWGSGWVEALSSLGLQVPLAVAAVVALACYGLYQKLTGVREEFFYKEYIHALRD